MGSRCPCRSGDAMSDEARLFEAIIKRLMGPLWLEYGREGVTELMINGPGQIFLEDANGIRPYFGDAFGDEAELRSLARAILQFSGKTFSPFELSQEARMPDRSRVHIVQSPASQRGVSIVIRKFRSTNMTLTDLVRDASLTAEAADYLRKCVTGDGDLSARKNIIVSGGTGSGKTTLLAALAEETAPSERLITIEDVAEISLSEGRHVVTLEAQKPDARGRGGVTIRELFRAALRMRPDRVIVGECRGGEALDMMQAMNSGHAGSLSTVHADDPVRALSRLETLCLMAGVNAPISAIRRQIAEAIGVVVQVERISAPSEHGAGTTRRRVRTIAEIDPEAPFDAPYARLLRTRFNRGAAVDAALLPSC